MKKSGIVRGLLMKIRKPVQLTGVILLTLVIASTLAYGAPAEIHEELERSAVSSYILVESGFFESGAYEQYLDNFVNTENPSVQNKEQDRTEDQPNLYFDFMGMDETVGFMGEKTEYMYHNRAFLSSLFYMEIPMEWYVGASASCPLVFCHESDRGPTGMEGIKEYYDVFPGLGISAENAEDEIAGFVLDGGVDEVLEDALGQPVTEAFVIAQDEPGSGWYSVEKDGKLLAEFYVWAWSGKVAVWPYDVQVKYKASEDYGRIYVFQEWSDQDFSTPEAIRKYVEDGGADHLLEPVLGEGNAWSCSEVRTEYHEFLRFEGGYDSRRAAFYIPVTPDYNENWLILFEASEQTKVTDNAYEIQERVLKSFILQPYYYVVKKGDILSEIAGQLTDHPGNYDKIARYKPNRVGGRRMNADLIYPGQKIAIPLDLLFQKIHYQ